MARTQMARGWKRAAEIILARGGAAGLGRRLGGSRTLILAYHNVVPQGEAPAGDRSLHLDRAAFADQLDFLQEHARVIGLAEAATEAPATEPNGGKARVAITFDDAYRGTMTTGLEELRKRDMPGTVFVPPGLLGSAGFWWDRLVVAGKPLDDAARNHALNALAGDGERIAQWATEQGRPLSEVPDHARPVTESELLATLGHGGLTLGAHTWSHPNLARVSETRCEQELSRSKEWLASRTDRYLDWLAYPYGLRSSLAVASASRHFEGALLVDGGPVFRRGRRTHPVYQTPRLHIPRGLSLEGLALRMAGLLT